MAQIKEYLISITAAAILCGVLLRFTGSKGSSAAIIRLLTGLFMAAAVLRPVITLKLKDLSFYAEDLTARAAFVATVGTEVAEKELDTIITDRTETYILDKAATMGVALDVEVILCEHIPCGVIMKGAVSPGTKARLSAWIEENLGIPTEAQQWT